VERSYAWTTLTAAALVSVLTFVFSAGAVADLMSLSDPQTAREAALGVSAESAGTGRTMTAVLTLSFCAVTALMAIGIGLRRQGSRHAGIAVFLLLGIVSLGSSFAGFSADPPALNAWLGALNGVACLVICGLLVHPRTAGDFDRAETSRRVRADQGVPQEWALVGRWARRAG
jgi:hypothetical protein